MAGKRSFGVVVWKKYQDDIDTAVSAYVEENLANIGLRTRRVSNPTEASVGQLNYQRTIACDTPGTVVMFDLVVSAEIEFFGVSHSQSVEDEDSKWFRLACEVCLDDGVRDFKIRSVEAYDHTSNKWQGTLSDTLVPIISTAELDKQAEKMLRDVYPEALERPTRIDVREFARRLKLTVEEKRLSRTSTIFGEMIFSDCTIDYIDDYAKGYKHLDVPKGTILVDPEVYFLRTIGSWNNTVIHECVHWYKHRKFFELERLSNPSISRIRCKVTESTTDEQKRSDTEWMEFHANAIAPRVLMPYTQFKKKADEVIIELKRQRQTNRTGDIISEAILVLQDFFDVSVQAAKIRMIDVGYKEAIGAYEYVDNRYVSAYSFSSGRLTENQSFSVPVLDGIIQYAVSADLRRMINSGNFVSVDNHFVINNPKYVGEDENGRLALTEYAASHIDECCLVFERSTKANTAYGAQRYTECALFQSAVSKTVTQYNYKHSDGNKEIEARAIAMQAELQSVKDATQVLSALPQLFGEALVSLMKWRKITVEKLAEDSFLSAKTVQRMRNEHDHNWELEQVMAVCVGLKLPPYISTQLISRAGLAFRGGEKNTIYQHLLTTHYNDSIYEFNEYLEMAGLDKLTNNE